MFGYRRFSRRRSGYTRKPRGRFGKRGSLGITNTNHFQLAISAVATATETQTTLATGIDPITNRSTHVPDGAILKYLSVRLACTTIPAAITRFQLGIWRLKGADTMSTPIADWFATTEPITQNMIEARQSIVSRVIDITKPASDFTAFHATLKVTKPIKIRDGDDIVLVILHNAGGNLDFNATVKSIYRYA